MVTDSDWLATTIEPVLEPELPIIDPHHHLWDRDGNRYLLDDLVDDLAGHNVRQTVFVECASMYRADGPEILRMVGETEFVQGIAAQSASGQYGDLRACTGIVARADFSLGDAVSETLEAHIAASPAGFRGIRHAAGWDASDDVRNSHTDPTQGLLADPSFRQGYARLQAYDLSFDAWLYHPQIPQLTDLARAFPDITVIFNHLGGPLGIGPYAGKRDEILSQWKQDIAELATCPNVVAKVGGIQMPINGLGWHQRPRAPSSDELLEANREWYLHMIEQFGPDRCMFESNFPVEKMSCSYTVLWNQFKKLTSDFSADDRAALFHDTALRVYRLDAR
ncbi:MAG: amidohydrolase family protein [Chloroflexi bacterium]|nr:amidohydrolase family protein [Chloroflexota bacterium]